MKVNITPIQEFISQLRISFLGEDLMHKYDNEKAPIRSELFSLEQLESYARTLAKNHIITEERPSEQLLKRLAENEEILLEVHNLLTVSAKENKRIAPAGEWLLDNFYLIEEQIYTGKKHLPKGYSKGLPQLALGPSAGLPRVYDIAVELIAHSDGRVDLKSLNSFTTAYQEVSELKLGELWAIPIMLRLALIENLRRLATLIAKNRINKNLADYWADQMTETAEKDPKSLILVIAEMARYGPPLESSFIAEFTRRLVGKGAAFTLPISWIEQRLSEKGMTSDELVHVENQKQAADQVSISNSIGSLRFLSSNDWREFVENICVVEKILRTEDAGIYSLMDFSTRDAYRHRVEQMAKDSGQSESAIARMALRCANEGIQARPDYPRAGHLGFYLVGKGYRQLTKEAGARFSIRELFIRLFQKIRLLLYAGASVFLAAVMTGTLILQAWNYGFRDPWICTVAAFFCMIGCSQLCIAFVNWISTLIIHPQTLPRMDFSKGIPDNFRTLVVIPSMFSDLHELEDLLENLEVRFLANRGPNTHFALLTDFKDAPHEHLPGEGELLTQAGKLIGELNKKYGIAKNEIFFLFHRPRRYNAKEKIWMGYERKRGKLEEMNLLLRGQGYENFSLIAGESEVYERIKYVITLDTDTQLPKDAAWMIAGTMAHPMNHPYFNEKKKRVTEGYGILQPRVAVSLPSNESTPFARMHGNETGIDPYTRAVSDVYQDIFGEGSFIGKGIYDVDAFEKALGGRLPENRILSHDLLEGGYARCGLISDVQLYEAYPVRYEADMNRRHRWIRGDWQIASWMLPWVPGPDGRVVKNPVSPLSRWKIFDNIRRSLVPIALLGMLLFGWLFSHSPVFWTLAVLSIVLLNPLINFFWEIWQKPKDVHVLPHILLSYRFAVQHFANQLFLLMTLPHEAFVNTDAIWKTNWRLLFSHRHLLQWNPSQHLRKRGGRTLFQTYISMWFTVGLALGVMAWMLHTPADGMLIGMPFLFSWLLVPAVAWKISSPDKRKVVDLSDKQHLFLHKLARKTWSFFENFVSAGDNWLPPDNFQESPVVRVAHRTSPTNIGLSLLSNLTAFDFGYIPMQILLVRISNTIQTLQQMERYSGHFYNWYDTQSLQPLPPHYISTVDSGNLAGHLVTLKQGLLLLGERPVISNQFFKGLEVTLSLFQEKMGSRKGSETMETELAAVGNNNFSSVRTLYVDLQKLLKEVEALPGLTAPDSEAAGWAESLVSQVRDAFNDLSESSPWLSLPECPERFKSLEGNISRLLPLQDLASLENLLLPQVHHSEEERI